MPLGGTSGAHQKDAMDTDRPRQQEEQNDTCHGGMQEDEVQLPAMAARLAQSMNGGQGPSSKLEGFREPCTQEELQASISYQKALKETRGPAPRPESGAGAGEGGADGKNNKKGGKDAKKDDEDKRGF